MTEPPEFKIEESSPEPEPDSTSDTSLPFRVESRTKAGVITSLEGRPDLIETARHLASVAATPSRPATPSAPARTAPQKPAEAAEARPTLVVRSPGGTMETRRAVDSPRFLVGRDNCDLELEDRFVSRWHVQLFRRDGTLVLQDLGSRNGVYLRIADDLALEDGDQICVGEQRFEFRTTWDSSPTRRPGDPEVLGASWSGSPARLIRYVEGDQIGGVYPLGERTTIGSKNTELVFPEDAMLSSMHATIRRDQGRYILRDTDSGTGTFIRIANAVELIDGDCFLVGRTRLRLTFS